MSGEVILIVDDDPDIRVFLEVTLQVSGFQVIQAEDGEDALAQAIEHQPELVLMDVMMPNVSGIEALERLRRDGRISHLPVILVTARAQGTDKLEGFESGADDYITKPFDPEELVARVQATLRRAQQMRTVSPLTGLPGNARIEQEIARRVLAGERFALLYADLNHFKAYNDHYGFLRGDGMIQALAETLRSVAGEMGGPETFVGHVGGDDFVVVTTIDRYEPFAEATCRRFDEVVPGYYDDADVQRGYVEVEDRRGALTRYGLVSVSIGVAHNLKRTFEHPSQPVAVATEMKTYAKRIADEGSNWAVDRRGDDDRALTADLDATGAGEGA